MHIRDEDLVRFLLGEADQLLRQRVQLGLRSDPHVAQRLEELRAALGLLDSLKLTSEPPADLVSRTMMRIDADIDSTADNRTDFDVPVPTVPVPTVPDRVAGGEATFVEARRSSNSVVVSAPRTSRPFWDSAVLSLSIIAISCLMLPLLLEARSQSRRVQCSYNLHLIGRGLTHLAMLDMERRFPSVPTSGPESFAGHLALQLNEAQLLESPQVLKCAGMPNCESSEPRMIRLPTRGEFLSASPAQQHVWRELLGGNYAFNFGVVDLGRIMGARLEGRTHYAVVSDAPRILNDEEVFVAHDGRGVNIFYEDGHVTFVAIPPNQTRLQQHIDLKRPEPLSWINFIDHPYRNDKGAHAAVLNSNDAALGPSCSSPLPRPASLP